VFVDDDDDLVSSSHPALPQCLTFQHPLRAECARTLYDRR
jgi:hypothetical protein